MPRSADRLPIAGASSFPFGTPIFADVMPSANNGRDIRQVIVSTNRTSTLRMRASTWRRPIHKSARAVSSIGRAVNSALQTRGAKVVGWLALFSAGLALAPSYLRALAWVAG